MKHSPTTFLTAMSLVTLGTAVTPEEAIAQKMEKCYGIVKSNKNDCAAADGRHTCAGYAKDDANYNEWILLPDGACDRIVDASTVPESELERTEN